MSDIVAKPVLVVGSDNVATLTFTKISGDGCELSVVYTCRNFCGLFCNNFALAPDYESAGLCWARKIALFPRLEFAVSDDGFAVADAAYDASEEYWEFADDADVTTWVALAIDLTSIPISAEYPPARSKLELHTVSGDLSAKFLVGLDESLPTTAPPTGPAGGTLTTSINGKFELDLTALVNQQISGLSEGSTLDELYVIIQINPTGTSGDPIQIASSRHATAALRPTFALRY